jgi:hypothetical protein
MAARDGTISLSLDSEQHRFLARPFPARLRRLALLDTMQ